MLSSIFIRSCHSLALDLYLLAFPSPSPVLPIRFHIRIPQSQSPSQPPLASPTQIPKPQSLPPLPQLHCPSAWPLRIPYPRSPPAPTTSPSRLSLILQTPPRAPSPAHSTQTAYLSQHLQGLLLGPVHHSRLPKRPQRVRSRLRMQPRSSQTPIPRCRLEQAALQSS